MHGYRSISQCFVVCNSQIKSPSSICLTMCSSYKWGGHRQFAGKGWTDLEHVVIHEAKLRVA